MAKAATATQKETITRIYVQFSLIVAVLLLIVSGVAFWAYSFTGTMVRNELSAQKIYFPELGSPKLDPATYPDLQQYAGQLVDSPAKAKAYANGYIGRHLSLVADGKVYAEVSTAAGLDPTNETLQKQKAVLFQGETLRGVLLTSGYGFGTVGIVAGIASVLALIASVGLFATAYLLRRKLK